MIPMGIAGRVQAALVLAAIAPQAPLPGLAPRETGVTALMANGWDTNVNLFLLASVEGSRAPGFLLAVCWPVSLVHQEYFY